MAKVYDPYNEHGSMVTRLGFEEWYKRHREWSRHTFGGWDDGNHPYYRGPQGPIDHLKKEIAELEADPYSLEEWIDVFHLVMDGYARAGGDPNEFLIRAYAKQRKNMDRKWPDYTTVPRGKAVEHVRGTHD